MKFQSKYEVGQKVRWERNIGHSSERTGEGKIATIHIEAKAKKTYTVTYSIQVTMPKDAPGRIWGKYFWVKVLEEHIKDD